MRATQACAAIEGRDYVLPDDVQAMAQAVLSHRLICHNQFGGGGRAAQEVISRALSAVPVPTEAQGD